MKIKTLITCILSVIIFSFGVTLSVNAYEDVPADHWACSVIEEATEAGIMQGHDNGIFGLGDRIKRSEFAAMLTRMIGWEKSTAENPFFSDIKSSDWFFNDVNTLFEHKVFMEEFFRPNDYITRCEMAVMLINALGYEDLAKEEATSIFTDVTQNSGYISLAYTLGIINGKSETIFDPDGFALREEGAAMMMRLYKKYNAPLQETHGFYAISSWNQKELAAQMDTVSFGWSRLQYTEEGRVFLNQTIQNGNDWFVPEGANTAIDYLKNKGVKLHLAVIMTDQNDCNAILTNSENQKEAINQIFSASKDFDGVTIDFEGMSGEALKNGLNQFIIGLKDKIGNKQLYIAVHPVLKNSKEYYDAYDYKTLGKYADRVIVMAHDYAAATLPEHLLNTEFIATPVTPFDEIYNALKAITDRKTGVENPSKVMLAISTTNTVGWNTKDKKIVDSLAIHPSLEMIEKRLAQPDTEINYSHTYKNPYAFYITEDNQQILLWYEDTRSIHDKIVLAKMFGINSVSFWRIGAIIHGNSAQYMNIAQTFLIN